MREQLTALRSAMAAQGIDAYLIPTGDFHGSEYVGGYFQCRAYVSGFTGSAGTLLVLPDRADLWTDGRYFLQAEEQLKGSGITLQRDGTAGTPTIEAFLAAELSPGQCLAFDGRTVTARRFHALKKALAERSAVFRTDLDLAGSIWPDRPPLSAAPVWALDEAYCGKSRLDKLADVRAAMEKAKANALLLSSLDDIAWLLNLRGGDVMYCPVMLAYLAIEEDRACLFLNDSILPPALQDALAADGIAVAPYEDVYRWASSAWHGTLWLDEDKTNCALWARAAEHGAIHAAANPTELMKAVKNETELDNVRTAHLRDGVALTKFLFWLRQTVGRQPVTERSAAERLEQFRREQEHYLGPSFEPILAYGPHGAIVHYSATEESDVPLAPEGFLLCDTGGHYLEGTTDVTRTVALGPVSAEMRAHYTTVLRSHLALLHAQFLHGCRGSALDVLARASLWEQGLDYDHGTGHGVGYLLNVHEGPNSFRYRSAGKDAVLEPGMILSDEPGLYLAGRYGIRLENLLACEERFANGHGRFLGFDALTLVPFDRAAIDPALLNPAERTWLNAYHSRVRAALAPYLSPEENRYLTEATAPV